MNDTSFEIAEMQREMCRLKTPSQRCIMGASMYDTSKYLVTRSILKDHPDISKSNLQKELFLRFYGDEFDPIDQEKIFAHFDNVFPS